MKKVYVSQDVIDKMVVVDRIPDNQCSVVYGVAKNDVTFKVKNDGVIVWQYTMWTNMLQRAYCPKQKVKNPRYLGVSVSEHWLRFGNFLEWLNFHVDYSGKIGDKHLDKDILVRGNKVYCPEFCRLVPRSVNTAVVPPARRRVSTLPSGVSHSKKSWACVSGVTGLVGRFSTMEEAQTHYLKQKKLHIEGVAIANRHLIGEDVFRALMDWDVGL